MSGPERQSSTPRDRRVAVACTVCRRRRTRCDGFRPSCTYCTSKDIECIYTENQQIRKRRRTSAPDRASVSNIGPTDQALTSELPVTGAHHLGYGAHNNEMPVKRPPTTLQVEPAHASRQPVDAYYGGSSTVTFAETLAKAIPLSNNDVPMRIPLQVSSQPRKIRDPDKRAALLPRRREADEYVRCYFELSRTFCPTLHEPTFLREYGKLWTAEDDIYHTHRTDLEEEIFNATINIVFALGCRHSSVLSTAEKQSTAEEFYDRSRQALNYDIHDVCTLSMVQLLTLEVAYLQSTTSASRCWNLLGVVVRMAQSLGLHKEPFGPHLTILQRLRRRVWQTIVVLDWLVSALFGRPAATVSSCIRRPNLITEEEYHTSIGEESCPTNFLHTFRLFNILNQVCVRLYYSDEAGPPDSVGNLGCSLHDLLASTLQLEGKLDECLASMPASLKVLVTHDTRDDGLVEVSYDGKVLSTRFLYTRLLLLRPALIAYMTLSSNGQATQLHRGVLRAAAHYCIESASLIIKIFRKHGNLGAWHTTNMTFLAATTLLAAYQGGATDVADPDYSLREIMDHAYSILGTFAEDEPVARQALQALRHLDQRVIANGSRHQQNTASKTMPTSVVSPYEQKHGQHPQNPDDTYWKQDLMHAASTAKPGDLSVIDIPDLDNFLSTVSDDAFWNAGAWLGQQLFDSEAYGAASSLFS